MKITKFTEETRSWGLKVSTDDYDSTPVFSKALFDRQPRLISPDRVALASYLLFGSRSSGTFEVPEWLSPALAEAIAVDARPVWLQASPVELYAKALPVGRREMVLYVEGLWQDLSDAMPGHGALRIMRSDLSRGVRMTFTSMEVSSNIWLFATRAGAEAKLRAGVAAALLFAEDLEMDTCFIPAGVASDAALRRLQLLVDTVRFSVQPLGPTP